MEVSYAPRKHLADWLRKGWRLVPGHEYNINDWAIAMVLPAIPVDLTDEQIARQVARFDDPARPIPLDVGPNNFARAVAGLDRDSGGRFRRVDGAPSSRRVRRYDSRRLVQESA